MRIRQECDYRNQTYVREDGVRGYLEADEEGRVWFRVKPYTPPAPVPAPPEKKKRRIGRSW